MTEHDGSRIACVDRLNVWTPMFLGLRSHSEFDVRNDFRMASKVRLHSIWHCHIFPFQGIFIPWIYKLVLGVWYVTQDIQNFIIYILWCVTYICTYRLPNGVGCWLAPRGGCLPCNNVSLPTQPLSSRYVVLIRAGWVHGSADTICVDALRV